ncbi:hypothetical protein AB833_04705 [Chromatiales bacterium (ex Bugula neritina AB1)]|nr:hypothetical protein AB833_04705 [Chromatiales bacterium (ex Bugula neritina AB1)]
MELVQNEEIVEGDQLPSEATLASRLGVSRNTIRELLIQMETEGLVLRNHGIGTILRRVPKTHGNYQSFLQLIAESGRAPTYEFVGPHDCVPTQEIKEELAVTDKKNVKKIERVLFADTIPVAFVIDYLPIQIVEFIENWSNFSGDMVAMIGQAVGHNRFTQNVSINAVSCDKRLADKLRLSLGDPVVHVHTIMQTMLMQPVASTHSYLRPNELPLEYLGTIRVTPDG